MLFVIYVRRSVKILILNKEGIIEKISYEKPILGYVLKNDKKKK